MFVGDSSGAKNMLDHLSILLLFLENFLNLSGDLPVAAVGR